MPNANRVNEWNTSLSQVQDKIKFWMLYMDDSGILNVKTYQIGIHSLKLGVLQIIINISFTYVHQHVHFIILKYISFYIRWFSFENVFISENS